MTQPMGQCLQVKECTIFSTDLRPDLLSLDCCSNILCNVSKYVYRKEKDISKYLKDEIINHY